MASNQSPNARNTQTLRNGDSKLQCLLAHQTYLGTSRQSSDQKFVYDCLFDYITVRKSNEKILYALPFVVISHPVCAMPLLTEAIHTF